MTTKSKFTATAPNGQILVRNTQNHTYNYAVLVLKSEEFLRTCMEGDIERTEKAIATGTQSEGYVIAQTKRLAKVKKELATVADTWFDVAWRRDMVSALQEADKITKYIAEGRSSIVAVTVVQTVKVGA